MNLISRTWGSSLGKKYIMAITGAVLFLFVIGHMVGNLQIFFGPEVLNRYAHFLQHNPEILWPVRLGLLAAVLLHIAAAVQLALQNRAARPVGYGQYEVVAASYASRTMLMSGIIIFVFVVYHLLHFTVQIPALNFAQHDFRLMQDAQERHDVFRMMVLGYQQPLVSGFYILAMALLCLHLSHGVSSLFQSLGWKSSAYGGFLDKFAWISALIIFIGNCSIPIAVLLGYGQDALK